MQLIILGMHRSGTSVLASLLVKMGVYFGTNEISTGANEENPKGFWERRDVRDLNDFVLSSINCDWDKVSCFDTKLLSSETIHQFNHRAKLIISELDAHSTWLIKEPRICLLFPLWKELLNRPVCIHIYRNPVEVAKSLRKRNEIPINVGVALWERYISSAINNSKDIPSLIVSHKDMMENPHSFARQLFLKLQTLGLSEVKLPSYSEISEIILCDLYHQRQLETELDEYLNNHQRKLYTLLENKELTFNPMLHLSQGAEETLKEFDNNIIINRLKKIQSDNHNLQATVAKRNRQLNSSEKTVAKLNIQLENSEKLRGKIRKDFNTISVSHGDLKQKLKLSELALKDKLKQAKTYKTESLKLDGFIARLAHGNKEIFKSSSWQIGKNIVSIKQKLLARPQKPTVENYISSVIDDYKHWRETSHLVNENYRSKPRAKSKKVTRFPSVDIIVCVHNALDDVKNCLNSVIDNTPQDYSLIIVNDGSNRETSDFLEQFILTHTSSKLFRNSSAQGYTKAANIGLRHSSAEYVVFLNSDTIVPRLWLNCLVECGGSDPSIGIIGPLSNAASWQSVPQRFDNRGDWAINELPHGYDVNQMAEAVYQLSERNFPRVDFVNGFCFAIKRVVIEAIGHLDEESFPKGYGEENDYCLRAADAGFNLAIADHGYVYHAKSKSYSHETRRTLSKEGSLALKNKHGVNRINDGVEKLKDNSSLKSSRERIQSYLDGNVIQSTNKQHDLNILFVMPVKGGSGGAHSVVQEALGMRTLGVNAKIATLTKYTQGFQNAYPSLFESGDYFLFFANEEELYEASINFDIIVATLWSSPATIDPILSRNPNLVSAYYIQDYEPWFFDNGSESWQGAYDSYTYVDNMTLFAKTDWLCRTVEEKHGCKVNKVSPSLDTSVYYPPENNTRHGKTIIICAMIRPSTPRRNPWKTLRVLKKVKQAYGNKIKIVTFGCDMEALITFRDEQEPGLDLEFDFQNNGVLVRQEVANILRTADVFVDFSTYQAFGRTGLEAMACGCAVLLPQKGGVDEYAIHEKNALLVNTTAEHEMEKALLRIIENSSLRKSCQKQGLITADKFSISRAVLSELSLFRLAIEHHIIRARKSFLTSNKNLNQRIKIAVWPCVRKLTTDPTGSAYIRLIKPLQHAHISEKVDALVIHNLDELKNFKADICIVQRNTIKLERLAEELIVYCQNNNIKLIHEIDDDLFSLQSDDQPPLPLHEIYALDLIIRNAACVVTSTPLLQKLFSHRNDNTVCIQNALDESLWLQSTTPSTLVTGVKYNKQPKIRVLYMGTRTHRRDISLIMEAWQKIEEEYPDKVSLDIIGAADDGFLEFGRSINIPKDCNYPEFVQWLRGQGPWDIGIIPLRETDFNLNKSYIKFLDYAALGLSIICTDMAPYQDIAKHQVNALVTKNTTENWYQSIKKLIDDEGLRHRLASASQKEVVEKYCLKQRANDWLDVYHKVLDIK